MDFRRMGQNKNKLVNITRKDGAIDLYFLEEKVAQPPPGGVCTWVKFCWLCAAGLSEPLPHYRLFCDQL